KQDCARSYQIVEDWAIALGDQIPLESAAVTCREARLIDIDLHRNRRSSERARIVAASQLAVDAIRLLSHVVRPAFDHGIDARIETFEPFERRVGYFVRRDFTCPDKASNFACSQAPEFVHGMRSSGKGHDIAAAHKSRA